MVDEEVYVLLLANNTCTDGCQEKRNGGPALEIYMAAPLCLLSPVADVASW